MVRFNWSSWILYAFKMIKWFSLICFIVDSKQLLISFSKLNVLLLVELVTGSAKISFVSLKTSLRWLCTFRFCKLSVTERMHALQSRFVQYSCKVSNCTWNLFPSKSLSYIATTSLHSWMKASSLVAFNKRFWSFMYVLKFFLVKSIFYGINDTI